MINFLLWESMCFTDSVTKVKIIRNFFIVLPFCWENVKF
jgi:hypothetical protein